MPTDATDILKKEAGFDARACLTIPIPDSEHGSSVRTMIDALAKEHMGVVRHNVSASTYHNHGQAELRLSYDFGRMSEAAIFLTDVFKFVRLDRIEVTISNPHVTIKPG